MHVASPPPAGSPREAGKLCPCDSEDPITGQGGVHTLPPLTHLVGRGPGCGLLCLVSVDINLDPRSLLALQRGLEASSEGGEGVLCLSVS